MGVKIGNVLMFVNDEATVQNVPPIKTTSTIKTIGRDAIFEFRLRKSGLGLFMVAALRARPRKFKPIRHFCRIDFHVAFLGILRTF
jgi:hypothetical protein